MVSQCHVSATYDQPYALVRRFSSLDHFPRGRIAWNIVTSHLGGGAQNLERPMSHDGRYELAKEVVADRQKQIYADPNKGLPIGHRGSTSPSPASISASRHRSAHR